MDVGSAAAGSAGAGVDSADSMGVSFSASFPSFGSSAGTGGGSTFGFDLLTIG